MPKKEIIRVVITGILVSPLVIFLLYVFCTFVGFWE